ncbi:hypothetical protein FYK55_11765 [Roseiconus nitratireducens]|uniref:Uncharacterized protein n=1 Tax=Roseiconus nitratireducens TaxID=2605748 RepID=A0A5M6DCN4_9BACT|nr:hypothetical protein [Roseiconus nitratireducens]KAA5543839.1 hypothetical protein FYK55_11765 [Roseiconus nitratireducens]
MSVKRVTCPYCRTSMNVAASMASVKCQHCSGVFKPGEQPATATPPGGATSAPKANSSPPLWLIGTVVAAVVLLVAAPVGYYFATANQAPAAPGADDSPAAPAAPVATTDGDPSPSDDDPETASYRVVDLPDSTRKKIYQDYQRMIDSSFGKAKRIPASGQAGTALRDMLGKTVQREITGLALIHHITEEDIYEIIKEGDAKGW